MGKVYKTFHPESAYITFIVLLEGTMGPLHPFHAKVIAFCLALAVISL